MAVTIKFDEANLPQQPSLILANRSGHKLGYIPAVNINLHDNLNSATELQFSVYKYNNGVEHPIWDDIVDFRLAWCPEWDVWFELKVDLTDGTDMVKNISGRSLGEAELSQINLYGIEINTETDISRDDYIPTVLYDETKPKGSLLNRIMEKAPHYSIGHVDNSIKRLQRTFTFDGTSILDALYEIGEEIDCLFMIDSSSEDGKPRRLIHAYDLETYCMDCGYRGEFVGTCPKCGGTNVVDGYGEDTHIFISSDNLSDEITFSSDTDSVKNCFRLEGGDDLMTATITNCNPNGSQYLWYLPDSMRADMSDELKARLAAYDADYELYTTTYEVDLDSDLVSQYNALINKYSVYDENLATITSPIEGYANLMTNYYNVIDFETLLRHTLMPSPTIAEHTAATEAAKLTSLAMSPTAVTRLSTCSVSTATSAVIAFAKTLIDKNFQVKATTSAYSNGTWTGVLKVTNYSDEEDTASTASLTITITDDQEAYLRQRINKITSDASDDATDISALFKLSLADFTNQIKKHCLSNLNSFRDAGQGCLDILIENGVSKTSEDLYSQLYKPYYDKLKALETEVALREQEIGVIAGVYDANGGVVTDGIETIINRARNTIQGTLNMENYLGRALSDELAAYRREDTYRNDNYISDGLTNDEIFANALQFIEQARIEIYKSATLQHSISSSLKNLLAMKEFAPIVDSFALGNWLTVRVDGELYRLRLLSYEIDFENLEELNVEFSDVVQASIGRGGVQGIIQAASSIASSYESVKRQAGKGNQSQDQLTDFVDRGLQLTQFKIINSADNQNIVVDNHGILCREKDPFDDSYNDKQLKIINRGVYMTDDGWLTAKAGIGNFVYYNPSTGQEEEGYGVIADTLIGSLILANTVGVYNKSGTIQLDENGLTLISDSSVSTKVFTVKRRVNGTTTDVIYFDNTGTAYFDGTVSASNIKGGTFVVKKGNVTTFYANADTGVVNIVADSFSLSNGDTIQSIASAAASNAVDGQTQQSIFNKLTNNGQTQGIYLSNGKLYINADYLKSGTIDAQYIDAANLHVNAANIDGTLNANIIKAGTISDSQGKNSWNLTTGDFSLSSSTTVGGSTINSIANAAASSAVNGQTQQSIFNKLTNNGQTQGIYLKNGRLYINANYIDAGILNGDLVKIKRMEVVNDSESVVASFDDVITLGSPNKTRAEIDYHSLQLVDKEGNSYFFASDLRDDTGSATITEQFISSGASSVYLYVAASEIISVTLNGTSVPYTVHYNKEIDLVQYPSKGDTIVVSYKTQNSIHSFTMGRRTSGKYVGPTSVALGDDIEASGACAIASGLSNVVNGNYSYAEGRGNTVIGDTSHAEGYYNDNHGHYCHVEGANNVIEGGMQSGHAEGYLNTAAGNCCHVEGSNNVASGFASHAEGWWTIAACSTNHVFGEANVSDSEVSSDGKGHYIEIVGNGSYPNRSNARTLDWRGNEWIAGTLTQSSDARLKEEVGTIPDVSDIKARRFKWKDEKGTHDDKDHLGYFAQDVEEVAPYLVDEDAMGYKSLDYIGLLVAKVDALERRISALENENT